MTDPFIAATQSPVEFLGGPEGARAYAENMTDRLYELSTYTVNECTALYHLAINGIECDRLRTEIAQLRADDPGSLITDALALMRRAAASQPTFGLTQQAPAVGTPSNGQDAGMPRHATSGAGDAGSSPAEPPTSPASQPELAIRHAASMALWRLRVNERLDAVERLGTLEREAGERDVPASPPASGWEALRRVRRLLTNWSAPAALIDRELAAAPKEGSGDEPCCQQWDTCQCPCTARGRHAAEEERDQLAAEMDHVVSAIERWRPLTDNVESMVHEMVNELHRLGGERDAAKAAGVKALRACLHNAESTRSFAASDGSQQTVRDLGIDIDEIKRHITALESEAGAKPASAKLAEKREDFEREVDEVASRRDEALRDAVGALRACGEHNVEDGALIPCNVDGDIRRLAIAVRLLAERSEGGA